MKKLRISSVLSVVFLASIVLVACGSPSSRVTMANFDRIEVNQTTWQGARDILGSPTTDSTMNMGQGVFGIAIWTDGNRSITLTFNNGIVTVKAQLNL